MNIANIYQLYSKFPKITTDSRKVEKNSIFFALRGNNFNGNKFAAEALKKGAAYAITDQKEFFQPEKMFLVDDVLQTLQSLAQFHRKKLGIPVLAITGSNGKTTTKELIASVLSKKFNVSFTKENLNNHIGLPLTLLEMTHKTEFGIVEMGANHPGEISFLSSVADPDYGIITNIGRAHLEGFGSFEAVIKAKAELYDYLKQKRGTIFYNRDNAILNKLTANYLKKISYGQTSKGFRGEPVNDPPYLRAKVYFTKNPIDIYTNLTGDYNFENMMAAAAIGNFFGIDPEQIRDAIGEYKPENNRSQLVTKNNMNIVMDAYNANPTSMTAAIKSFASGFTDSPKYLILGDMLELGPYSKDEHTNILGEIGKYTFKDVFLIGTAFSAASQGYEYKTYKNTEEFCRYLQKHPVNNCNLLIKGSRAVRLEKILQFL